MRLNRKNRKILFCIVAVLLVALTGTVTVLAIQMNKQITTKSVSALTDYDIGTLDANGKVIKSSENIYTKDYINVDGLKVTIKEKADVQYKLYFYDADKTFVSASTTWLTADFDGNVPANAKYARVLIDPTEDAEVSALEVFGYANQLTVTYNK